ncbi:MAG: ATP-dependent transcriptional regulator, MalT-like, LuxR family [Glaciihabitans sp.]|nr:ATP-dependent transcriptional regulator, MalT-like, LuxR family [Glaciihabitans sp.]
MRVLATKLFVPPPRVQAIARPRLIRKLDDGATAGRKLTLISAPAGFGKTTVLSEWIAASRITDPALRVGWLSLEDSDNDPARFLTYLVAAMDASTALSSDPTLSIDSTMTSLINEVAQRSGRMLMVLDDFQLIENAAVRDAVTFLLDHTPANLHLAIASRSDPLLPVARLRARGELTELRAADLRFTTQEAAEFLTAATGLALTPGDVAALEARTEGWIAGLQLAALSLRERTDASEFIAAFTGSNRFVIDYLIEEVLDQATLEVRDFLCQTAILDRLSGPLCDAVTGGSGSTEMLAALERANLFVVPLDDQRQWYRYHHLFADVLQVRLLAHGIDHANELHSRASEWFEHNGAPEEAVRHALAGSDFARAARVIESTVPAVRKSRQDTTLLRWLALLPQTIIDRRPVLRVFSAWSSLVAGDIAAVEPQLASAEQQLVSEADGPDHESEAGEELDSLPVTIAMYRAAIAMASGDILAIRTHAQRALDLAAPDDYLGRGGSAGMLGLAAWSGGDLEGGAHAFRESSSYLRKAGNLLDALSTTMVVGDMLLGLGRLSEAQLGYERALLEADGHPPTADLHAAVSEIFLQRGQLEAAADHLNAAEALGASAFSHEHRYRWSSGMARLRKSEGDLDAALAHLIEAQMQYRRGFFPDARPLEAMKARIWITQGRLSDAGTWIAEQGLKSTDELTYLTEFGHLTLARWLLAQKTPESLDEALALLARLAQAADLAGRHGSLIEILVLQSLALQSQQVSALAPLERALALAEPEGITQIFLDEGEPMLQLLRDAAGAGIRPEFVRTLSRALRATGESGPASPMADSLSDRELHVLRLLATGLSGPEIAHALHVSLNTMRTHTKHIFLKLEVNDRATAVRRAESLGLI